MSFCYVKICDLRLIFNYDCHDIMKCVFVSRRDSTDVSRQVCNAWQLCIWWVLFVSYVKFGYDIKYVFFQSNVFGCNFKIIISHLISKNVHMYNIIIHWIWLLLTNFWLRLTIIYTFGARHSKRKRFSSGKTKQRIFKFSLINLLKTRQNDGPNKWYSSKFF